MAQVPVVKRPKFSSVRILFATATGNAEDIAHDLAHSFHLCNTPVICCCAVDDYSFPSLPSHAAAGCLFVFIVATAGDGEAPGCMSHFWSVLRRASLPRSALADVHAAVFGLGDRSYPKFNAAARRLATRLVDLGASLVVPLALGDDSNPGGFDATLRSWTDSVLAAVVPGYRPYGNDKDQSSASTSASIPCPKPPPEPRIRVSLSPPPCSTEENGEATLADVSGAVAKWHTGQVRRQRHVTGVGNTTVVESTVSANSIITNPKGLKDEREVRHIELDVSHAANGPEVFGSYLPGDIVNVVPPNRQSAVDAFLKLVALDGDSIISVDSSCGLAHADSTRVLHLNGYLPCSLSDFVAAELDLTALPRRRFLERLAAFCPDELQRQKLVYFASADGADDFVQYAFREKRTILMVLRDFPSARPPLSDLIDMIPPLRPRAFSIASSRPAHGLRIHICAAIVKYTTILRFERVGVCSSMWSAAKEGDIVPIYLQRGTLRFDESAPAILVGPGTGVAPMRSFVSSLAERNMTAETILYFGCRHKQGDFLYSDEWSESLANGRLQKLETAFSRDTPGRKVYVQDLMLMDADKLWKVLNGDSKGRVYVAGAAGDMPKAIRLAVCRVASLVGGLNESEAERYVKRLEGCRRFQIECW